MFDQLENEDANVEGEMEFENPGQNETMESRLIEDRNSRSKGKKIWKKFLKGSKFLTRALVNILKLPWRFLIHVLNSDPLPHYNEGPVLNNGGSFLAGGACCSRIRVTFVRPYYNVGAHALLKNRIYKDFRKQWGNSNGRPYYRNGNYGVWNCGRGWYIGEIRYRGQCSGLAANNIHSQCPPRSSNRNWIYRNRGTWQNAGRSLVIICSG